MTTNNIKKGKTGPELRYELSFRRKVMAELFSGTITKAALRAKYNLSSGSIHRWVPWYEQEQQQLLTSPVMKQQDEREATPETATVAANAALQEQLRQANIKLVCLEALIDLTEKDLGIDIRKNGGTRSSVV